jgi:hypothetical protein
MILDFIMTSNTATDCSGFGACFSKMNVPRYVEQQVSRIAAAHSPLDE